MKVTMNEWFRAKKQHELYENYHAQHLYSFGEVVGESEKAYKLSVMCMFISNEKPVTIWAPKSACEVC